MKTKSLLGLDGRLVSVLCYAGNLICFAGLLLSILVLIRDKKNKLTRFHASQSILLSVATLILTMFLAFNSGAAVYITGISAFAMLFNAIGYLVNIAVYLVMALMVYSAFKGEFFKLPYIGNVAERFVNKTTKF